MSGDQLDLDAVEARNTKARAALNDLTAGYSDCPNALSVDWALRDNAALVAEVRRLREECADAWDGGHKTRWRRGPDNCQCSAWSSGECACGEYGTGELLSLAQNPYR